MDEDKSLETEIINPAYQEVAPCPCDLHVDACDIGCCCDEVSAFQRKWSVLYL